MKIAQLKTRLTYTPTTWRKRFGRLIFESYTSWGKSEPLVPAIMIFAFSFFPVPQWSMQSNKYFRIRG